MQRIAILAAVLCLLPSTLRADLIAYWHFNDSNILVDQGAGILETNFTTPADLLFPAGSSVNSRSAIVAGQSLGLKNQSNNGRYLQFRIDTSQFEDVSLSFATQRTGTGFSSSQISYSADGNTFVNLGAVYDPGLTFNLRTFDFSPIAALDNNLNSVIRITLSGATAATGNTKFDNIQVTGSPLEPAAVPEPSTMALAGLGALGALAARWRRGRCKKSNV